MTIGIKNRRLTIDKKPQKLMMVTRRPRRIQSHDWSIKLCIKRDIILTCRLF